MLKKPCVRSRGHNFHSIIMKLGQNFCLDEISDELKNGSCSVNLRKPCVRSRDQIFSLIIMKLGQNDEISDMGENGSCRVKN